MDEQGRDILSYLEGETWSDSGSGLSDELLEQAARALQRYHDATAGSNALLRAMKLLPIMSWGHTTPFFKMGTWWDSSIGTMPGLPRGYATRANAVYNYVDISHWANQEASEQARRIHLMLRGLRVGRSSCSYQ